MSHPFPDEATLSLFGDGFRRLVRMVLGHETGTPAMEPNQHGAALRRSSGMREFWKAIEAPSGLQILDLGSASQANVNFITGLQHKLYTEDLHRALLSEDFVAEESDEIQEEVARFFCRNLKYDDGQFDGILCWDLFDFLPEPLVKPLVDRLLCFLKPGGTVLSFFHTAAPGEEVPIYQYHIRTEESLQLSGRGTGKLLRHFNNRNIENLFLGFNSLKFYLARDNLREVISVR